MSSPRLETSVLVKMALMWSFTVCPVMWSSAAMVLVARPRRINAQTCASLGLSE